MDSSHRPAAARAHRAVRGFSLVEVILLIFVLGVLASVALPRFSDEAAEARLSRMELLYARFQSGTRITHAFWTDRGQPPNGMMTVQGHPVPIVNGWPSPAGALGMLNAGNPTSFTPVLSAQELEVRESAERPQCRFIYRAPVTPDAAPEFISELTRENCAG
jgi:type II secretory pathway pseudopilin PulG